jgi:hypothetical protein
MFSWCWDYLPTSNKLQIYRSWVWSQLMAEAISNPKVDLPLCILMSLPEDQNSSDGHVFSMYLPTSNKLQIYRSRVWSQLMTVSTNRNLATEKKKESPPWAPACQFVPPWPAKMAGGQCWRVIRLLWHLQRQEKNVVHSTSKLTSIKSLLLRLMLTRSINLHSNRNSQSATKSDRHPECHTEQVYYLCNF